MSRLKPVKDEFFRKIDKVLLWYRGNMLVNLIVVSYGTCDVMPRCIIEIGF